MLIIFIKLFKKQRNANKGYNKCGYARSLKHLKSLYTFSYRSGQVILEDS